MWTLSQRFRRRLAQAKWTQLRELSQRFRRRLAQMEWTQLPELSLQGRPICPRGRSTYENQGFHIGSVHTHRDHAGGLHLGGGRLSGQPVSFAGGYLVEV
jgi:hypothetical protein